MIELEHMGVLRSDNVPDDSLLGHLVGIVHHKFIMKQKKMQGLLEKSKLPEEYWPNKPRPIPSFQAACRFMESPKYEEVTFRDPQTGLDIKFGVEYMVDKLKDGSRQLTRKINYVGSENVSSEVRKILEIYVDTTQKEPEKMAKFEYDTMENTIKRTDLFDSSGTLDIKEMTDKKYKKALSRFNELQDCYTERYLKDAWYRILRDMGGIPWLKNCGSLWFVPKEAKNYVEAFGEVYCTIHGTNGTWRAIPIINTKQHREYLREDVEMEYTDRFKSFLKNVADRIDSEMDDDKKRELIAKSKDNFESKLSSELVSRYNNLLGMSISAKVSDLKVDFESTRLNKAREFLMNL